MHTYLRQQHAFLVSVVLLLTSFISAFSIFKWQEAVPSDGSAETLSKEHFCVINQKEYQIQKIRIKNARQFHRVLDTKFKSATAQPSEAVNLYQ
jgi:hypothetical protein